MRPAAEVRLDGDTPSGLVAVVVSPHPAWMLDVAVLGGPDAPPMARAGVTWAITRTRDLEPLVATSDPVEPDDESLPPWVVALRSQNR